MRPMTPLPRDLHPSNGRRGPSSPDDVVVPISAAFQTASHARRQTTPNTHVEGSVSAEALAGPGLEDLLDDSEATEESFPTEIHWEILEMLSQGCDDEIIAHRLKLDPCTYRGLVADLLSVAGACNRFQLALKARDLGWV